MFYKNPKLTRDGLYSIVLLQYMTSTLSLYDIFTFTNNFKLSFNLICEGEVYEWAERHPTLMPSERHRTSPNKL